jgi:hypothetical protein
MQSKDERDADAAALRRELQKLVANYTGPVRQCAPGETMQQAGKRRPPSHSGEEKRVRRNAWKHGYRIRKPRGETKYTLIGAHDLVVLDGVTLDTVDAFLGGAPANPYSDEDNQGVGSGS